MADSLVIFELEFENSPCLEFQRASLQIGPLGIRVRIATNNHLEYVRLPDSKIPDLIKALKHYEHTTK